MPDNNQRNRHKLIGIRPDDDDRRILSAIQDRHGLSAVNAIRLALRTQGQADGLSGVDPTAFRPPARGNPKTSGKKKTQKTPEKTAILKKSKKVAKL